MTCPPQTSPNTEVPVFEGRYRNNELRARLRDGALTIMLGKQQWLEMTTRLDESQTAVHCDLLSVERAHADEAILAAYSALFSQMPSVRRLLIAQENLNGLEYLLDEEVLGRSDDGVLVCEGEQFWQYAPLWLTKRAQGAYPMKQVMTHGTRHPLRPPKPRGELYRRFIPWLGKTLTLEVIDPDKDLLAFNRWMNSPRVAHFWEEQGDLEKHQAYIERQLIDPHTLPIIGHFDGIPFGYFEIYWAREDRIAPFYEVDDYDRGLHLLVGEEAFRGKAFYTAWFSSICHYMFLDDPRTQRLVCEPRHDNHRQIANFDRSGFAKIKHFDFPHKRALLVMLWRERFFSERLYQPLAEAGITFEPSRRQEPTA